jgi:hypothetical protein
VIDLMDLNTLPFLRLAFCCVLFFQLGCSKPYCPPPKDLSALRCANGLRDEGETGIDCGGTCETNCTLKTVVLQPGSEGLDAYVGSSNPNDNNPTYGNYITAWTELGTPYTTMVYFAFDYASIPSTANIQRAILTLYADTTSEFHPGTAIPKGHSQFSYSNEWLLKKALSSWQESTLTWNNKPAVDESSTIELTASSSNAQAYTIDLSTFVKEEFASGNPYGFRMEAKNKIPYNCIIFYSSDGPYPNLRPKMEIEYY